MPPHHRPRRTDHVIRKPPLRWPGLIGQGHRQDMPDRGPLSRAEREPGHSGRTLGPPRPC